MRIKELTRAAGRTISMAKFEFIRSDASVTVELEEGDSVEEAAALAVDKAQELCDSMAMRLSGVADTAKKDIGSDV